MKTIKEQQTFRHKLAYLLGMHYLQYENYRFEYFLEWCRCKSNQMHVPFSELSKNDHLINWFDSQWVAKVEGEIKRKYEPLEVLNNQDIAYLIDCFYEENVQNIYPATLLKEIAKELKLTKIN